jgi:hypothetical protein
MTIGPDEIAVRLLAGTAEVEGVTITMGGPEAHLEFKPGQQYVMLVNVCPDRVAILPHTVGDVFRVTPEGRLAVDVIPFPFVREALQVGSVDRLEALAKSLARP